MQQVHVGHVLVVIERTAQAHLAHDAQARQDAIALHRDAQPGPQGQPEPQQPARGRHDGRD